jgi:uncharacterized MAPEG superfamily protein
MTLTTVVLLVLLLYLVQIFLQETSRYGFDFKLILGNRDVRPEMSVVAARLDRAKNNMMEALPLFLGLAVLALAKGVDTSRVDQGAVLFLFARIAYVADLCGGHPGAAFSGMADSDGWDADDGAVAGLRTSAPC